MSRIRILPDILSNKIAAGEVVERPSSVVKELVENSLDAGSRRIMVEVDKGGRSLIRVADDGCGMSHDDALMAIERFATSKIRNDEDLFNIATLGFRGEAIPSIASVSRFTLVTRESGAGTGFSVRIDGGKLIKAMETGAPKGTMVTVGQLFFNTPARRKFLKTVNTEMGHIADVVSSMAMAHPSVQFKLTHNGKTVKDLSATSDPLKRIAEVIGPGLGHDLYPVNFAESSVEVSGAVADPRVNRATSRNIFVYVNGRFIRDRVVQHAIFEGYRQRLMKGQFPVAVLFVRVPPDSVDVNVHPTKHEVRFAEQRKVHDAVRTAVEETLKRWENRGAWPEEDPVGDDPGNISESAESFVQSENEKEGSKVPESPRPSPAPAETTSSPHPPPRASQELVDRNQESADRKEEAPRPVPVETSPRPVEIPTGQQPLWQNRRFSDLKIIGQCHNTYIVLESSDGVVLLDQHAAHERVLYESLSKNSAEKKHESQALLVPETFDMNFSESDLLEKMLPGFEEIGLHIEPFGGNTFVVKAVPVFLEGKEIQPVIREIVEKALETGVKSDLSGALDESLKLMACHGAIRAGQKLSELQIKGLLRQLDACQKPSNCPHGRPTWIRWGLKSLEKSFHRIV